MLENSISRYILTFTLLELFVKTHLTIHDNSHGFINPEKYLMDDIASYHEGFSVGAGSPTIDDLNLNYLLKFEPEYLDFKQRPLGVPHLEKVTLRNVHSNRSIDMTSISGSTVHFHSSFFEDKKIPPLGNTTFNVVFLGREEGAIESNLFIHTNEGRCKYQVKGASVYSPYRLRPIVGIKLPLNATFSPFIYMHNPHTEPIQIVEVYSSGGEFHLELPSGELEGPKDMWEILPFQTKAVIRVRFHARTEQNHTAYVRIKLNNTEEVLVVPLEVEVTSVAGLFEPQGYADFGVGGSLDVPRQIKLFVQNPLKKAVRISSVTTTSKAIKIDFENIRIAPDLRNADGQLSSVEIATLTLDWHTAFETKDFSGKIIVTYKNGKGKTEIPYYTTVLEGGLSYDSSVTRYFINKTPGRLQSRDVKLKNDFLSSVMLLNVSLAGEAQNYFVLTNFNSVVLKPGQELNVVTLKLKSGISYSDVKVNSHVLVKTNVSDVLIRLLSFNGKLELHLPYKSKGNTLDLGLISTDSKKEVHFLILNRNPVGISLRTVKTGVPSGSIEVIGCFSGNHSLALLQNSYENNSKCGLLETDHYAILRLTVQTFSSEGQMWSDVIIETQYEQITISVHFKVAQGKLEIGPDRLVFDQCFPGKLCSHPLRVHSTFNEPMVIENILTLPPDPRITSKHSGHILARATKVIGHLYLDPNLNCKNECYCGLDPDIRVTWLKTLVLPHGVPEFDLNLVNIFYNRYLNQTANGARKWQNLTLRLDTSEVRGHLFKTRMKMSWPSLLVEQRTENKSLFVFPLTQVGNVSYQNITIRNPSSHNLVVQVVLDRNYPELQDVYEGLPRTFTMESCPKPKQYQGFFFHESYKVAQARFDSEQNLPFHKETIPVFLHPDQNFTFTVGYKVDHAMSSTATILIRNNLTIVEIIKVRGQSVFPNFKFGNRRPGSSQPLLFELTEKHLKDCEREKNRRYAAPNLTVKRSFTARNTGDITVYVNGFYINGQPCEGHGFKVLNCEAFRLLPNATRKIDIAFTPDFTLAKITRNLELHTSLNVPVSYTLVTTVPVYYLSLCSSILARPNWELYLYYTAVCLMCFLLFFVVIGAIMDSERVVRQVLVPAKDYRPTQPTLNLHLIGQQTRAEMRQKVESDLAEQKVDKEAKSTVKTPPDESPKQSDTKETEKYPVLIPATGKQKKKLSKKNSNELANDLNEIQKKPCGENQRQHKNKHIEPKAEPETDVTCKKHIKESRKVVINKKPVKQIEVPVCEEETSSTTTESSNNEEPDKEYLKNPKQLTKKLSTGSQTAECTDVHHEFVPAVEIVKPEVTHTKLERKRSGPRSNGKQREHAHDKSESRVSSDKPRAHKSARERKEKHGLSKKLSKPSVDYARASSPTVRVSPSIPSCSFWSENRAKFSDVVARSDSSYAVGTPTRSFAYSHVTKPTVYVEPYKQANTELGPIGSKKVHYWHDSVQNQPHEEHYNHMPNTQSNSFFTDSPGIETPNTFLDFGASNENWQQQTSSNNLLDLDNISYPGPQMNTNSAVHGTWAGHSGINTDGFWDSVYSPPENTEPAPRTQSGYLWGSSSVWEPWAPEVPKTPTRTPPGFTPHREIEERMQQQSQLYNPFDIGTIWTQQQSSRWDYQQQE